MFAHDIWSRRDDFVYREASRWAMSGNNISLSSNSLPDFPVDGSSFVLEIRARLMLGVGSTCFSVPNRVVVVVVERTGLRYKTSNDL